ncbi:MAG: YbbR-like domain-containing protein [Gemmatimonadota bacterium]|nr:MAG: YbbR-like domain-containing protein [Gemmatimonadota bacterium]
MTGISKLKTWLLTNWPIKLTALVLAIVLWAVIAAQEATTRWFTVTLDVRPPTGRVLTSELPQVQARYTGTLGELFRLTETPPTIRKVMPDTLTGSTYTITLSTADLVTTEGIGVVAQDVTPDTITLELDDVMERRIPVVSRVGILPAEGFGINSLRISPESVTVRGPEAQLSELRSIGTSRLDTTRVREPFTLTVPLDSSGLGVGVRVEPPEVQVFVEIVTVSEQVIMGVTVSVPAEWTSDPSAVIVIVNGPSRRVVGLTRDSVRVRARPPSGAVTEARVPLTVQAPAGITATASPDSVTVRRRAGG